MPKHMTPQLAHSPGQARRQEMKWGCCVKKVENGGVFFCKEVDISSTQGALCTVSVLLILHFIYLEGCIRTQRTPLPTGLLGDPGFYLIQYNTIQYKHLYHAHG